MEELKLTVNEFIEKLLEKKIDSILSKFNIRDNESRELICSCDNYAPYTDNGPCRFCYGNTHNQN
jgi:hypothetical protein